MLPRFQQKVLSRNNAVPVAVDMFYGGIGLCMGVQNGSWGLVVVEFPVAAIKAFLAVIANDKPRFYTGLFLVGIADHLPGNINLGRTGKFAAGA